MNPTLFLAFAAFVGLGLPDGLLGPSWPSIRAGFGVSLDALGALATATIAGYLMSSSLSGAILRVMSLGAVLGLSTGAAAAALLGMAAAPAWPLLLACGFVAGASGGAIDAGLNAYGAAVFDRRTMNWLHAAFGFGAAIGPLVVAGVLASELSWRWSYALAGGAQALLAVLFVATRRGFDRVDPTTDAPPAPSAPASATLRQGRVRLGMAVFFLYSGVEFATAQWSYSLLVLERGMAPGTAGILVALYWGALTAGRIAFGFVADRVDPVRMLRLCLAGVAAGALVLWLEPVPFSGAVGLVAMGALLAPVFATLTSLTPARVGAAHADAAIGFQIAAAGAGGAVLTVAVGWLAERFGLAIAAPLLLAATLLLLAAHEALARASRPSGVEARP